MVFKLTIGRKERDEERGDAPDRWRRSTSPLPPPDTPQTNRKSAKESQQPEPDVGWYKLTVTPPPEGEGRVQSPWLEGVVLVGAGGVLFRLGGAGAVRVNR